MKHDYADDGRKTQAEQLKPDFGLVVACEKLVAIFAIVSLILYVVVVG